MVVKAVDAVAIPGSVLQLSYVLVPAAEDRGPISSHDIVDKITFVADDSWPRSVIEYTLWTCATFSSDEHNYGMQYEK